MKSYGVAIQINPFQQYFYMELFVFKYLGFVLNFDFRHFWEGKDKTRISKQSRELEYVNACFYYNNVTIQQQTARTITNLPI